LTPGVLVVALLQLGHPARSAADVVRARLLAVQILDASEREDIDPVIVAAMIARESAFNAGARGGADDLGLMQIRRGGAVVGAGEALTDAALMLPPINLAFGVAYLARQRAACARHGVTDPVSWISRYKGLAARPSRYSRGIVAAAARARAAMVRSSLARGARPRELAAR